MIPPNADNRSLVDLIFCVQTSARTTGRLFYYCHLIFICVFLCCLFLFVGKNSLTRKKIWCDNIEDACLSATTLSWKQAGDNMKYLDQIWQDSWVHDWLTFPADELFKASCLQFLSTWRKKYEQFEGFVLPLTRIYFCMKSCFPYYATSSTTSTTCSRIYKNSRRVWERETRCTVLYFILVYIYIKPPVSM